MQIAVPISSLHDLPIGAGYERSIGRASARLVRTGRDTVSLTAHCDSLQVLVDELLIQRDRLEGLNAMLIGRMQAQVSKTSEPIKPPWRISWTVIIILLIALGVWRLWRHIRL